MIPEENITPKDDLPTSKNPMEKLEDALVLCKFGRFQFKLMLATILGVLATTSVSTSTSYILPSAECDLSLTMIQKGLLNAIPFLGQMCASIFTGFIADAFGRRIVLIVGNLGMFLCGVFGASSQRFWMLMVSKSIDGVCMSLGFIATATMVTEFSHRDVRDRVLLVYSSFMSMSIVTSVLLAWAILPQPWILVVVEGYFEIHSWNAYLYASAVWSLLAAILYYQLPESPKFLLSHGQENKALDVLKNIYVTNTRNKKEDFPIHYLNISGTFVPTTKTSFKKKLTDGLFEVKELFRQPLLCRLILFSTITFVCLLAYSALRLWFPQLSTIIENYIQEHPDEDIRFCSILDHYKLRYDNVSKNHSVEGDICIPQISGTETYTNGIILGIVSFICIITSAYLVDLLGQKPLMFLFLFLCSACSIALYWTTSSLQIAILISATCGFMQTAFSLQHSVLCRVFPTTVRNMAMSLVLMQGRVGSLLGNILFPIMLRAGCMVPFVTLSVITFCSGGLVYFLPNPKKENSGTGDK